MTLRAGAALALVLMAGARAADETKTVRLQGTLERRPAKQVRFRLLAYPGPLVITEILPEGTVIRGGPVIRFDMTGVRARLDAARAERKVLLEDYKKALKSGVRQTADAAGEALAAKEREIFYLRVDEEEMRGGARTAAQGTLYYGEIDEASAPGGSPLAAAGEFRKGGAVQPEAVLATIRDESSFAFEIPVTEEEAAALRQGTTVRVRPAALPDLVLDGIVERVTDGAPRFAGPSDQTYRVAEEMEGDRFTVRIGVPRSDPRLLPGMRCSIETDAVPAGPGEDPEDPFADRDRQESRVELYGLLEEWYSLLDGIAAAGDPKADPRRPIPSGLLSSWVPGRPLPAPAAEFLGLTEAEREAVDAAFGDEAEAFRAALARMGPPKDVRDPQVESVMRATGLLAPRQPGREPTLFELVLERQGRASRTVSEVWQHGVPEALGVQDFFCKEAVFGAASTEVELWGTLERIRLDTYKRLQPALRADRYVMLTRLFGRFGFQSPGGRRVSSNDAFHPRLLATWAGGVAHFKQDVAFMRREVEKAKAARKQ